MTNHDDSADGPFEFKGVQEILARLRETCLHVKNGKLVALTDEELAEQARSTGIAFSRGYMQALSSGTNDNPTADKLVALSNAYGVTPLIFFSARARRREFRRLDARLDALRRQLLFGSSNAGGETAE